MMMMMMMMKMLIILTGNHGLHGSLQCSPAEFRPAQTRHHRTRKISCKRFPVLEQVQALLERASKRGEEFVPHELSIGPKVPFSAISSGL
ncbi:uncharacterized protein CLUP02_05351 [Colletotrichum lupini]|uniref:Secreted protein n=1 Tax=Colletotrichum lupini TaxID=145971 RepID=A0A9Q8SMZ7_9PEZI|nr:uncharacterized protein CLUP02_05351 [Colletotrichum lupini]UQC79870.1 hypothetical protein CLUP02_05351 [Colletotrichum lupini]